MIDKKDTDRFLEIANSSVVDEETTLENLNRLVSGNLSHLGDAIISGDRILLDGAPFSTYSFNAFTAQYTIKERKIKFGSIEINEPYREMPDDETQYFTIDGILDNFVANYNLCLDGDSCDNRVLKSGLMFKTKEDASIVINEIIRMLGGCA